MRITWPGASGGRMGSGMGAGGSACATGTVAEINEMARTTRTLPPKRAVSAQESQLGGQQLSDLNRVQRRTFSQVVAGHEQGKATAVGHTGVLPDAADK